MQLSVSVYCCKYAYLSFVYLTLPLCHQKHLEKKTPEVEKLLMMKNCGLSVSHELLGYIHGALYEVICTVIMTSFPKVGKKTWTPVFDRVVKECKTHKKLL